MVLEIKQRAAKLDYDKADIYLLATNPYEENRAVRSCQKEPGTVKWLEDNLRPTDTFYDIGASTGPYSLVAARVMQQKFDAIPEPSRPKHGRVMAFEPFAHSYTALVTNIILNACSEWVWALPVALGKNNKLQHFQLTEPISGAAFHLITDWPSHQSHPILYWTLDSFRNLYELPGASLVKIDVDGREFKVLSGMRSTLKDGGLRSVLIEVDERFPEWDRIEPFMKACGFEVADKHDLQSSDQAAVHNWVFNRARKVVDEPDADSKPTVLIPKMEVAQ